MMDTLYTPADWAAETALRIEYIGWLVETQQLKCFRLVNINLGAIDMSAEGIMKLFREQGFLIVNSGEDVFPQWKVPSFEEWRELKYSINMGSTKGMWLI